MGDNNIDQEHLMSDIQMDRAVVVGAASVPVEQQTLDEEVELPRSSLNNPFLIVGTGNLEIKVHWNLFRTFPEVSPSDKDIDNMKVVVNAAKSRIFFKQTNLDKDAIDFKALESVHNACFQDGFMTSNNKHLKSSAHCVKLFVNNHMDYRLVDSTLKKEVKDINGNRLTVAYGLVWNSAEDLTSAMQAIHSMILPWLKCPIEEVIETIDKLSKSPLKLLSIRKLQQQSSRTVRGGPYPVRGRERPSRQQRLPDVSFGFATSQAH